MDSRKVGRVEQKPRKGWTCRDGSHGGLGTPGATRLLIYITGSIDIRLIILNMFAGPQAASYLQRLTSYDLQKLTFGTCAYVPIEGFNLHVARGGYTGEDGFEVRTYFTVFVTELHLNTLTIDFHTPFANT